jgi:hypothetical protein
MGIVLAGVFILLALPFFTTDYFKNRLKNETDAVTSASVIIDKPSGEYLVLINRLMHTNEENLDTWIRFFDGGEISYLFEDISCSVISADSGALKMAQSFQSRLPEKQMSIQTEDASLLMSRADFGKFDIIVISKEFADAYDISTIFDAGTDNTVLIEIISKGESE